MSLLSLAPPLILCALHFLTMGEMVQYRVVSDEFATLLECTARQVETVTLFGNDDVALVNFLCKFGGNVKTIKSKLLYRRSLHVKKPMKISPLENVFLDKRLQAFENKFEDFRMFKIFKKKKNKNRQTGFTNFFYAAANWRIQAGMMILQYPY